MMANKIALLKNCVGLETDQTTKPLVRIISMLSSPRSPHTYDVIAKALYKIHRIYKIQNKIVSTTTDNGSNFVKAFNTYSNTNNSDSDNDSDSDDENENVDLFNILNSTFALEQESDTFIQLSHHYRCASHTLDLIVKSDVDKMINTNSNFKKFYRKMLGKCSAMWSKQKTCLL